MTDLFAIDGKHVLVTGGSSGLGRFFAERLAARALPSEALAKSPLTEGA